MSKFIKDSNSIFCFHCQQYSRTIEPYVIKKYGYEKLRLIGVCEICGFGKIRNYAYNLAPAWYKIPMKNTFLGHIIYSGNERVRIKDIVDDYINPVIKEGPIDKFMKPLSVITK